MKRREHIDYLQDILDSIIKIERFVATKSRSQFSRDEKTVFAVVRALEIIGEAAGKIPVFVRKQAVDVPWREMAAMRNKLIHEYFGIDKEVVWETVENDLPAIKPQIKRLIDGA